MDRSHPDRVRTSRRPHLSQGGGLIVEVDLERPALDAREASQIARAGFGVEATAIELAAERDRNFRLTTASGRRYLLKVSNPTTTEHQLAAEAAALKVSARGAPRTPDLMPARNGAWVIRTNDGFPVRLLTWVPGVPLATWAPRTRELLRSVGHAMGCLTNGMRTLPDELGRVDFPWELGNAPATATRLIGSIVDHPRKERIRRVVDRNVARAGDLARVRRGLIHGDANDYNILVEARAPGRPPSLGLVDFGDMCRSAIVAEVAITAAYGLIGMEDPLAAASHVVAGFHAAFPLERSEVVLIHPLIEMRLALSAVMAAHQRSVAPDNEYLSVHEESVWEALGALEQIPEDAAREAFRAACGYFDTPDGAAIAAKRTMLLGPSLRTAYRDPLTITRGRGVYLYDDVGNEYLDCVNNVAHVGHGHPRVVAAAARQTETLNTNTRYLHPARVRYAERLVARLPGDLEVVYLVNSGSEANDLALRLARSFTKRRDLIVFTNGYHGHTTALIEASHYKHAGPGGSGTPEHVKVVPMPDPYRGSGSPADVAEAVAITYARGGPAAFLAESLPGVAGQIVLPGGYLADAYRAVREAGGLCIADEVQVGLGRVGSHFWGFETQSVIPDIVTMGKPIGNGHPLGAVATTREIAEAFSPGMEYFNTFGGNPVSCQVGLAVLDVIEDEELQSNAADVGTDLMTRLDALRMKHDAVGEVRGLGLFIGVELVVDPETKLADPALAGHVVEHAKDHGVLLAADGPHRNVIKIKPPLVFGSEHALRLTTALDAALTTGSRGKQDRAR